MAKINLYSPKSKKVDNITLPGGFTGDVNESLLAQAIHVYRDKQHPGGSKVKTRAQVELTKAKWYRQKGTGRARHGAKSAPVFVGGGVAHGPKGVKRVLSLPQKMRTKALESAIRLKTANKHVAAVKELSAIKKTSEAQALADAIREGEKVKNGARLTFIVSDVNTAARRYFRNVVNVHFERNDGLNAYRAMFGGHLVFDANILTPTKKETKKK